MAENKLGIGRISFPSDTKNELLLALVEFVRRSDDNVNYLLKPRIVSIDSAYSATDLDSTILADGTLTITLPEADTVEGKHLSIKNVGTGTITIDGAGSETIDGATTLGLSSQYDSVIIHCDGSNWYKIGSV
jgi:hypothetical protein